MTLPTPHRRPGPATAAAALATVLLAGTLTSCADPASTPAAAAGTCPATIVSQLSWYPDPTHAAFLTPLVHPRYAVGKYTVDNKRLSVTGTIRVPGLSRFSLGISRTFSSGSR